MYTLSPNEKLGMQVEQIRLAEIRQEIEARRLAADVQEPGFGVGTLMRALSTFVAARKAGLFAKLPEPLPIRQITKSPKTFFESN